MSEQAGVTPVNNPAAPAAPANTPAPPADKAAPGADIPEQGKPDPAAPAGDAPKNEPAPPNLDDKPEPTPPADDDVVVEYNPTGDAGLDLALKFVGELGFGPEREEIKAAVQGDFSKLEGALKSKGDKAKGYERYLAVAKESYAKTVAEQKAAVEKTTKAVYEAAGGEARWSALRDWVVQNADAREKAEINQALKAGPLAAQALVSKLSAMFAKSGQDKSAPKSVVNADAPRDGAGADSSPLSRQAFFSLQNELIRKYGQAAPSRPEYKSLLARRAAGMKQGI